MKRLIIGIVLLILLSCSPKRESAKNLLAYVLLTSPTETGEQSIVIIEETDPFTYTGVCYDHFYGITASNYYTIYYQNVVKADPIRTALSKKSCSDLSFSGGYENITDEGIRMKAYSCGHVPKSCSSSAIKAVGF
ncbi:MAG: hypothetical protein H7A23_00300 [Leptospiraceae bacterium]|nr:hypothetical protein [Leptospiraceae bacterium]